MTALWVVLIKNGWLDWFWISNPMLVQYWSKIYPMQWSDNIRIENLCQWWEHCKEVIHLLMQVPQVLELERFVFNSLAFTGTLMDRPLVNLDILSWLCCLFDILVVNWTNRAVIGDNQTPWNRYKDPSPHIELPMLPIWHSCGQLNQPSSHSLHPDTMEIIYLMSQ